jgi:hypothetical protein
MRVPLRLVIGDWFLGYAIMGVNVFLERYSHRFHAPPRLFCRFPQPNIVGPGYRDVIASHAYNSFVV